MNILKLTDRVAELEAVKDKALEELQYLRSLDTAGDGTHTRTHTHTHTRAHTHTYINTHTHKPSTCVCKYVSTFYGAPEY